MHIDKMSRPCRHITKHGSFHSAPQLQAQLSRSHSSPKQHGRRLRRTKTCATRMCLTNGSITWTRARVVSSRRTTTSPTCRKDMDTGRGQDLASAACATPSWTRSWNTEKPAAPPKLRGGTTHAFTLWCAVNNSKTRLTASQFWRLPLRYQQQPQQSQRPALLSGSSRCACS